MTNFTNKTKLPNYLADWCLSDSYEHQTTPNTLSATTLLKPVKPYWLSVRHTDTANIDLIDLVASRYGTAIHDSVEKIDTKGTKKEERLFHKLKTNTGVEYTITGKYDIREENEDGTFTLRDIKTTSVWAFIYGGKDDDYQKQLSIYRYLHTKLYPELKLTDHAFIDFFFTDWQSSKAKQDPNYPQYKIAHSYKINLLSMAETEKFIIERISLFDHYKLASDEQLPDCSFEELWSTEDTFAVMKKDAKRATKVCSSQKDALQYMNENGIKGFVEFRPGKAKRCKYCSSNSICQQYKNLLKQNLIDFF